MSHPRRSAALLMLLPLALARCAKPAAPPGPDLGVPLPVASPPEPATTAPTPSDASASPTLPPFSVDLSKSFQREHACDSNGCRFAQWLPTPEFASTPIEGLASSSAIWVERMAPHARLTVPAHPSLRFVLFVLGGNASFTKGAPKAEETLAPFDALDVPGAGFELECGTTQCAVVFSALSREGTLGETLAKPPPGNNVQAAVSKRSLSGVEAHQLPDGKGSASILFSGDAAQASFSLTLLRSIATHSIPTHQHEQSWENVLVLSGGGELSLRGRPYPIAGGETLSIPPNVRHGFRAGGQEPTAALLIYVPAGPERRFMK